MADAVPSRLGQINGTGDALATFQKVFAGETLATFKRSTHFRDKHKVRTISSGKSAQFPTFGNASAPYIHVPGEEILGQRILGGEKIIEIEGQVVSPYFIPNIDDAMIHYDYRSEYSRQVGEGLAQKYDGNVARVLILNARNTVPNVADTYLGASLDSTLTNAAYATTGATIFQGIYDAGVLLDERYVPEQGRHAAFRPVQYALLVNSEKPFDFRLNDGRTGLGGYAEGRVALVYNIPILKTPNLPNTNDLLDENQPTGRRADYSVTQGLVWHDSAAATVELRGMQMEQMYDMRRQGWLGLGKYTVGHGALRPEASIELQSGAPAT